MSLLGFLGGYDNNPGMNAARRLYDTSNRFFDPNSEYYQTRRNNFTNTLSKQTGDNIGFSNAIAGQNDAMNGVNSSLLRNSRYRDMVSKQQEAVTNASANFASDLYDKGAQYGSSLLGQGAGIEYQGEKDLMDTRNSFLNNLINGGIGLASGGFFDKIIGGAEDMIGGLFNGDSLSGAASFSMPETDKIGYTGYDAENNTYKTALGGNIPMSRLGNRLAAWGTNPYMRVTHRKSFAPDIRGQQPWQ